MGEQQQKTLDIENSSPRFYLDVYNVKAAFQPV